MRPACASLRDIPTEVELAPQRSAGRWPPGMEDTDQGINGCFRRRYERHVCRRDRSVPGVVPGLFDCVGPWGGGGGDEETRTPDPLLAKEVLYQLSYVPSAPGLVVGVSGLEPEASALSGQCSNQLS